MLVGHIAVSFIAKRIEPRLSLGTLVLAAMLPDVLFFFFVLAGIEHIEFKPGMGAANYIAAVDFHLSHSLLMNAIWAILFAAACYLKRRYLRVAVVAFAVVLSHWLLDFIAHPPDMQLAPGLHQYFGLGLWTSIPATLVIEGGFWLLGIVVYLKTTRANSRWGVFVFWPVVLFLTLAWYGNIAGPPPRVETAPLQSFIFFSLVTAWAFWMNRLRPSRLGDQLP